MKRFRPADYRGVCNGRYQTRPFSPSMPHTKQFHAHQSTLLAAIFLLWLAFAIRLHNLAQDSLWIDELITVWDAQSGLENILNLRGHPPLMYLLVNASIQQFGETEFGLRLVSFWGSLLAIPLLIALGRAMGRSYTGILAAFFLTLSPFHLRHAQEARHYALLMTISLAAYLLLYLAIRRPTMGRWAGFGLMTVLNLLTHYGAFVVLACQSILIAGWVMWQLGQKKWKTIAYPLVSVVIVTALFTLRLPQIQRALDRNLGGQTLARSGAEATIPEWLTIAFKALGTENNIMASGFLLLAVLGAILLVRQRNWFDLAFLGTALLLPLPIILVTGVQREALPRYIIYMLPFYLLLTAVPLITLWRHLTERYNKCLSQWAAAVIVIGLLLISGPTIQAEYEYEIHDWHGVVTRLIEQTADDNVIIPMTLTATRNYNIAHRGVNYYLSQTTEPGSVLHGSYMALNDIAALQYEYKDVWVVIMHGRGQKALIDLGLESTHFQQDIYLIYDGRSELSTLEKIADLYEKILPLAKRDLPYCLYEQELAAILLFEDPIAAATHLRNAQALCPDLPNSHQESIRMSLLSAFEERLSTEMADALTDGRTQNARQLAAASLKLWPQDETARNIITYANLLDRFVAGEATAISNSPEQVRRDTFHMPTDANSDSDNVLFLHPPGQVSYQLTLPPEPTRLQFRIGMAPQSWDWGGDGAAFFVTVTTADGRSQKLLHRHIRNTREYRYWHPFDFSLADYAGQTITLTLGTDPGSAGDTTGDWALWERPSVVWESFQP
ncbi:MAG: hypothetical protein GY796_31550 [Chloroflexi bacterium]|nr:hypothetical protein [Chloroflexota bacterium]